MTASGRSRGLAAGLVVAVLAGAGLGAQEPPPEVTKAQFDAWMTELSNWGRWGDDDQLGALNLITPAKRVAAAKLVQTGQVVSMARAIELQVLGRPGCGQREPEAGARGRRPQRVRHRHRERLFLERYEVEYHGLLVSHLDALCHVAYEGRVYNGRAFEEVATAEDGCTAMGIINAKDGLVTRGVLVDMPGKAVTRADIEAWGGRHRHHHFVRRRPLPAHGPRRRPTGRLPSVPDPVPQGARHRAARLGRAPGRRRGRGRGHPDSRLHPRRARRPPVRQPRPRGPGPDRERGRPLGVPLHRVAPRGAERRRVGDEPNRRVLVVCLRLATECWAGGLCHVRGDRSVS